VSFLEKKHWGMLGGDKDLTEEGIERKKDSKTEAVQGSLPRKKTSQPGESGRGKGKELSHDTKKKGG